MNTTRWLLLMVFCLLSACNQVEADPNPLVRTLTVSASAKQQISPDTFSLEFGFTRKSKDLALAKSQVDEAIEKSVDYLISQGVEIKNINSMNINLYPWFERENNNSVHKGFNYSRNVLFSLQDLSAFDVVIQGISEHNPNIINNFVLSYSNYDQEKQALLNTALVNARKKAETMAKALNMEVFNVVSIQEAGTPGWHAGRQEMRLASFSESKSSSLPGEQTIVSEVVVTFEIAPKIN